MSEPFKLRQNQEGKNGPMRPLAIKSSYVYTPTFTSTSAQNRAPFAPRHARYPAAAATSYRPHFRPPPPRSQFVPPPRGTTRWCRPSALPTATITSTASSLPLVEKAILSPQKEKTAPSSSGPIKPVVNLGNNLINKFEIKRSVKSVNNKFKASSPYVKNASKTKYTLDRRTSTATTSSPKITRKRKQYFSPSPQKSFTIRKYSLKRIKKSYQTLQKAPASQLSKKMKFRKIVVSKKAVKEKAKDNSSRYFDTSLDSQPIVSIIPRRLPKDLQEQQKLLESHKDEDDDEGAKVKAEDEAKRKRKERVLREFADVKTPDCGISSKKDGKKGATTSSDCDNVNMPTYFKFS